LLDRTAIVLAGHHQFPCDAGDLVGERDRGKLGLFRSSNFRSQGEAFLP
jgi:hypothetical protein